MGWLVGEQKSEPGTNREDLTAVWQAIYTSGQDTKSPANGKAATIERRTQRKQNKILQNS